MNKSKILIVEDSPIVAEDIRNKLEFLNYEVTAVVTTGEEALKAADIQRPDIALMDIRLGEGMDGIDTAYALNRQRDIPIIYLTAFADEDTLERAKKTKPYGYIVKPFVDKELQSTIEVAVYKQRADRQVKESQQWLETTLNSIGDGVIATDMDGRVTFINPVAESLTGWSKEEATGKPLETVFNIINENSRKPCENPVVKVIETGQIIGLANHTLLVARDGREIPIKDSGAPIRLNGVENLGVVLVFQDDTKDRKSQEIVRRQNQIFKALNRLFSGAVNCRTYAEVAELCLSLAEEVTGCQYGSVAMVNDNGRFDTLALSDPGWEQCRMAELDPSCIQDMEIRGIWRAALNSDHGLIINDPCNHPQSIGMPEGHPPLNSFLGMPFRHKNFNGMIGIANKEGGFKEWDRELMEDFALAFSELINSKRSEAALRESEERFRSLIEASPQIVFLEQDGKFIYGNPAGIRFLGKTDAYDFFDMDVHKAVAPEFRSTLKNLLQNLAEGKVNPPIEVKMINRDGDSVWILSSSVSVKLNGKGTTIIVGQDITEKKRLENQLLQAHKMEAIGTLAGGIAHDFNNVLSSIIGFTELALDDANLSPHLEENLQEVYKAGKRAKDLVWRILAFARQSEENPKPIQVDTIALEVLKFLRSSIPTSIDIEQAISSDSLIMGNPTQVHQIIMNLCTNAAHAMEDRGGVLKVSLKDTRCDKDSELIELDLKPGDYIEIKVSDTGVGIPADIINSVFDPYFTTKDVGEGTGMGLAVVHGIVESCGGKIRVESQLRNGTVFSVFLPISKKRREVRIHVSEKLPTGTERILFVDDEAPIAKMCGLGLERRGYKVTTRTSSVEALELFKSKPNDFNLVISDMTMPNMSGDNLALELMKIRPDIPVILCTGYSKKISEKIAIDMGIRALVYKPIIHADLAKTIRNVLDEANRVAPVVQGVSELGST